ncbi:MAG: acyl-CoA thioesterase [Oleiphilus sp.]
MPDDQRVLFQKEIEVRWADCDANNHMRHTAYSDFCAHTRIGYMEKVGLGIQWSKDNNIGPVLFKEETEYKREAHIGERLRITLQAGEPTGFTKSIQMIQRLYKEDGELAASHKCVVAWMDLTRRKIVALPEQIRLDFQVLEAN